MSNSQSEDHQHVSFNTVSSYWHATPNRWVKKLHTNILMMAFQYSTEDLTLLKDGATLLKPALKVTYYAHSGTSTQYLDSLLGKSTSVLEIIMIVIHSSAPLKTCVSSCLFKAPLPKLCSDWSALTGLSRHRPPCFSHWWSPSASFEDAIFWIQAFAVFIKNTF